MAASCLDIVLAMPAHNKATTNSVVVVFNEIPCALLPKYLQGKTNTNQYPFAF